jgi:large subunit ribosomal protein L30
MADTKNLKITLHHGLAGATHTQKASVHTLGLHRIGQSVVRPDEPSVRGLIQVVRHLVTVEEA